jgi:hypothetical protein
VDINRSSANGGQASRGLDGHLHAKMERLTFAFFEGLSLADVMGCNRERAAVEPADRGPDGRAALAVNDQRGRLAIFAPAALAQGEGKQPPAKQSAPSESTDAPGHDAQSGKPETAEKKTGVAAKKKADKERTGDANRPSASKRRGTPVERCVTLMRWRWRDKR